MKSEPLKNKRKNQFIEASDEEDWFMFNDIKSAVEWLKKGLCTNPYGEKKTPCGYCYVCQRIDKSFEDVVKK